MNFTEIEQDALISLLERRKNKLIRVLLGTKERLYPEDPDDVMRKVVLDEVNDFFEQVVDIVTSLQGDRQVMVNQFFLDKIDELRDDIREVAASNGRH